MYMKITTTITTLVDVETFEPTHEVAVESEEALPQEAVLAAVEGGLKSALNAVQSKRVTRKNPPISDDEY